jgi:hypothetical protein
MMKHHLWQHKWKVKFMLLGSFLLLLWLCKGALMSNYLSSKVHLPVYVGSISMWPNETSIRTFKITNPRGFGRQEALQAKRVKIRYTFSDLFRGVTEIEEIVFKDVHLNIEILKKEPDSNNWTVIGARMPSAKTSQKVIIRKLTINNLTAEVGGKGAVLLGVAGTQHFDQIEFTDIDSQAGFPTKELVAKLFEGAGVANYLERFLNPLERVQSAINPFDFFGN